MPAQLETLRKRRSRDQGSVLVFVVDGLKRLLCTPVVTFGGTVRGLFAKSVQPIGTFEKREKSTEHLASTQFCNAQPVSSRPVAACQKNTSSLCVHSSTHQCFRNSVSISAPCYLARECFSRPIIDDQQKGLSSSQLDARNCSSPQLRKRIL
jgi:hypothetical protein